MHFFLSLLLIVLFYTEAVTFGEDNDELEIKITEATIEDLLQMNITSVSKIPEKIQEVSSSIYVLTNEDIRRSGATTIPDALRLVPGVQVARIDGNKFAVTIRGFNSRTSNKLLVMIDGRTIYDPLFSGVLWELEDMFLDDIDRIEVVKGPGGSTWGANAMNGVINIITKNAEDTQGALVSAGGGTEERALSQARYGGKISDNTAYRIYGKYQNQDEAYLPQGSGDDSFNGLGGFKVDSSPDEKNKSFIDGMISSGHHDGIASTQELNGKQGHILAKWDYTPSNKSTVTVQSFYNRTELNTFILGEVRDTFEFDVQHYLHPDPFYDFVYGTNYRYTADEIRNSPVFDLSPSNRSVQVASVFGATHLNLIKDVLTFETGAKLEHNEFTGFEVQPNIGTTWTVAKGNILWSKIARAVRTPSRLENDFKIFVPNTPTVFEGNQRLESENLTAYELGYRAFPFETFVIGISAFYNVYDDLFSAEGVTLGNKQKGDTQGVEIASTWQPLQWWELKSAYTFLRMNIELDPDSISSPTLNDNIEGNSPHNQVAFRSLMDLGNQWQFDATLRYVDSLSSALPVSSYVVMDARLGFKPYKDLDISVVGQNLFDPRHFEQRGTMATQVQQGIYAKLTWSF